MKTIVVLGSSGQTGRLVVKALLDRGIAVISVVRDKDLFGSYMPAAERLTIHEGSILEMDDDEIISILDRSDDLVCCLGHNLSFSGVFGRPRRLVRDSIMRIVELMPRCPNGRKRRIVLMNTTGNTNRSIPEKPPTSQRIVVWLLRHLLPPHVDNEQAADFLRLSVGPGRDSVEWVAVRPDGLIDVETVTPYSVHPSPIRNAIFDAGKTSRVNVADFMASLLVDEQLWNRWNGQMPVIYDDSVN